MERDEFEILIAEDRTKQNLSSKIGIAGAVTGLVGLYAGTQMESPVLTYAGLGFLAVSTFGYMAYTYHESEKFNKRANDLLDEYYQENK